MTEHPPNDPAPPTTPEDEGTESSGPGQPEPLAPAEETDPADEALGEG